MSACPERDEGLVTKAQPNGVSLSSESIQTNQAALRHFI